MKKQLRLIYIRNVFVLLIFLEIIFGAIFNYRDGQPKDDVKTMKSSGLYKDVDIATVEAAYREMRGQQMRWKAYTGYQIEASKGDYFNIDERGRRKTYNISSEKTDKPFKIFCFGGSTIFGFGARDEYTIPSELSKLISKKFPDKVIEVSNFGCHGYVRAIENIQLQCELIHGNIPDIVIFYDGVNDVNSAYQNNRGGLPSNSAIRIKEFKTNHSFSKRFHLMLISSNIYRMVMKVSSKMTPNKYHQSVAGESTKLANEISLYYKEYVNISEGLGNQYDFKVFNFLQPVIYSKKQLTIVEKEFAKKTVFYEDLYHLTYAKIRTKFLDTKDTLLVDISTVFDTTDTTVYTDFCHTGEKANKIVAEEMFTYIQPAIKK